MLAAATLLAPPAMAQPFGLVADDGTKDDPAQTVNVFDLETNEVVASIPVGPGEVVGDVAITPDQTLGFATDFNRRVWVIDLTTSPPSLAEGTNPIRISNPGEELSVTPDGRFLVVNDGTRTAPISVIDIAARDEISKLQIDHNTVSNDICDDGSSVLVASDSGRVVRRLSLAADGTLSDTDEVLSLGADSQPLNVYCAPGSNAGLVVISNSPTIQSFTVPGLAPVDSGTLLGNGSSAVFNAKGDRVFVRSRNPGSVQAFDFDPATGAIGAAARDTALVTSATAFFGIDQLALGPGDQRLYVPEGGSVSAVSVFDAADLMELPLASIEATSIVEPTGIAVGGPMPFEAFDAVLELDDDDLDDDQEFELDGAFALGANSNGIDPANEEVTLTVGSLSVTVPAGSFKFKAKDQAFEFEEESGGQELEIEIKLRRDGTYSIEAEVEGADLGGVIEPVSVTLTIGDDSGETVAALEDDEDDDD